MPSLWSYQGLSEGYRYGYQGSEKDDEVKGEGNSYTTEFRMLDPRLWRWLSIDPLEADFPWQSPYVSMDNNPICLNDVYGLSADGGDDNCDENEPIKGVKKEAVEIVAIRDDIPANQPFNVTVTTTQTITTEVEQPRSYAGVLAFAGTASLIDGPLPIGEIVGVIGLIGTALYFTCTATPTITLSSTVETTTEQPATFYYVTYTKTNPTTGEVYVGRTSGYGSPQAAVNARDVKHHMGSDYGPAVVSTYLPATIPGGYPSRGLDPSYHAIRGSEQFQIEMYRNLGISANSINGISPTNKERMTYLNEAVKQALKLIGY
jgi:RHS repeat-associated protein